MNRRTTTVLAAALSLTAALAISGCSSDSGKDSAPKLSVSGAFMPEPVNGDMAGGFLTVKNEGGADKLTSVTSALSGDVQIHETKNQKMQQVTSMDVPADGELKLKRGGNHIMFMGLKNTPKIGDKVAIELHFEKAGTVKAELDVRERTYNPKSD
ncbi:copper chaperone PCu(A)C [Streptomyces bambusae]|uniref:copper chaperone PCu(A)C n=1 Tax=Streptomyces bambusae TaxID=1550616 RepID=UPI001CFE89F8|nr:copper chaperone PCu(A)C [Streptomyces bambusae]MCB5163250.1 copper chaperone PCu(A)C [Streptomyces bambusae]